MPAIAVVGAGPGLGLSIARVFGRHEFDFALKTRQREAREPGVAAPGLR
jgi:NAD(P)-dependent dehydrogenase (short-subunit alcohol dehydrogenase family)